MNGEHLGKGTWGLTGFDVRCRVIPRQKLASYEILCQIGIFRTAYGLKPSEGKQKWVRFPWIFTIHLWRDPSMTSKRLVSSLIMDMSHGDYIITFKQAVIILSATYMRWPKSTMFGAVCRCRQGTYGGEAPRASQWALNIRSVSRAGPTEIRWVHILKCHTLRNR